MTRRFSPTTPTSLVSAPSSGSSWTKRHSSLEATGRQGERGRDRPDPGDFPGREMMVPMLDHLSIQCADVGASSAFYDAVLATVGGQRVLDFGQVIGYGAPPMPDFWIGPRRTGEGFREVPIA